MLAYVAAASIIAALVFYASRHFLSQGNPLVFDSSDWLEQAAEAGDLPCPWCRAPTREADQACPSCARAFGSPVSG